MLTQRCTLKVIGKGADRRTGNANRASCQIPVVEKMYQIIRELLRSALERIKRLDRAPTTEQFPICLIGLS